MIAFTVGALVAFLLSVWLNDAQLSLFGWRIALLAGTIILPFALMIRSSLPDFPAHADAPMTEAEATSATSAGFVRLVILGMLIIGAGTTTTYIFLYMSTFAQHTLHLPTWVGMAGDLACNGSGMITAIIGGWLSDKVGRRPAMIWPQLAFVIMILPMFAWFLGAPTATAFVVTNLILSGLGTMPFSAAFTAVSESLPRTMRSRAFALVYTIPVTTMGGTTQPVLAWLIERTHNPAVLAYYMMGIAVMGLAAMLFLPESAPMSVRRGKAREALAS